MVYWEGAEASKQTPRTRKPGGRFKATPACSAYQQRYRGPGLASLFYGLMTECPGRGKWNIPAPFQTVILPA